MTCGDIIARVDELEPNQYSTTLKLYWLSILDGQMIQELLLTHEIPPMGVPVLHWKDPLNRVPEWHRPPPPPPMSGMPSSPVWPNVPIAWGPPMPPRPPMPPEESESAETEEDACQCEDCTGDPCRCGKGRHEEPKQEEEEKKEPKPPYTDPTDELIIRDPYGSQIYLHWLQAQIASENSEIAKYNQQMALYNAAYQTFCNYINSNFMPKRPRGGNRFHF